MELDSGGVLGVSVCGCRKVDGLACRTGSAHCSLPFIVDLVAARLRFSLVSLPFVFVCVCFWFRFFSV